MRLCGLFTQNKNKISEGMISVPESILKPIIDVYLDTYAQFQTKKIRATKSFPQKTIQLDLKGTKWESLSTEPINIILEFLHPLTRQNPSSVPVSNQPNTYRIKIVLEDPRWAIPTIEHEVVHALQDLMKKKATMNWKKKHGIEVPEDEELYPKVKFGLPPKKTLIKTKIPLDYYGNYVYKVSPAIRKTPIHEKRPCEHYTDILTAVRSLRNVFEEWVLSDKRPAKIDDEKLTQDTIKNRMLFFKQLIDEMNRVSNKTYPFRIKRLAHQFKESMKAYKKMSKKMWYHMLAIAYDQFVNKEPNYDMEAIYKQLENLRLKHKEEPSMVESLDHEPIWRDIIKGEWWINKDGTSDYADIDVGEAGHEMIAVQNLLSEFSDKFREAFEKENISGDNISEFIESDDFEHLQYAYYDNEIPNSIGIKVMGSLWNEMRQDPRKTYSKHTGAILAINNNFATWQIDAASLRAMQDFIWELMSNEKVNLKDADVVLEEWSTKKYAAIPVADFLEFKGPRQIWRHSEIQESVSEMPTVKFVNKHLDFAHGQNDFELVAQDENNKTIGYVSYSIPRGEKQVYINYVSVAPEYRKKGIGQKLIKKLIMHNIGHKIDWGVHTPEGLKLRFSLEDQGYGRFFT